MGDVRGKVARSASQAARCSGFYSQAGAGNVRGWEDQNLSVALVANWKCFETASVVGCTSDGKRVGKPAEETTSYLFTNGDE
jgi:hypothetical protein